MTATVRVYVITYRRPHLLERALRSLREQTHPDWNAEVLNDDPADQRVGELISRLGDPRIQLARPAQHRGGTENFNQAFRTVGEPFASLLEDDNWWEPTFLATMLAALGRHPDIGLACGNERLWQEQPDGRWLNTGRTVWPEGGDERAVAWNALDQCGSARLCNSSLVYRTGDAAQWRTPAEIPLDVTEHFRERIIPHPFLLVPSPLVNYAQTLTTHRSPKASVWAVYQLLLVGSVFALARPDCRAGLARALWQRTREQQPLSATTLLVTGRFVPSARELWVHSSAREKWRFFLGALRHPGTAFTLSRACVRHAREWSWLLQGPFADFMSQDSTHLPAASAAAGLKTTSDLPLLP